MTLISIYSTDKISVKKTQIFFSFFFPILVIEIMKKVELEYLELFIKLSDR